MESSRNIRPSQFVTTYGVGSLLRIGSVQRIIPSLCSIVEDLLKKQSFSKQNRDGKRSLDKFRILDQNLEMIIKNTIEQETKQVVSAEIRIFKLPANADLSMPDGEMLYHTDVFPRWAICKRHNILRKLDGDRGKVLLQCSACKKENRKYDAGIGIRFIRACHKGHMDDVDWRYEVHGSASCSCDEYDWKDVGNNFVITCRECEMNTDYNRIKHKSESGNLICSSHWPENNSSDSTECSDDTTEEASGTAKLVLKNASNLRIPHVVSSLVIPPYANRLYKMLGRHDEFLLQFSNGDFSKKDIVASFELNKSRLMKKGVTAEFISQLKEAPEDEIKRTLNDIFETMKADSPLTILNSENKELEQLLQASKHGYPKSIKGDTSDFVVDVNKVEEFNLYGLDFVAAPVDILHVIKAQLGYRREVKTRSDDEMALYRISPTGDLVPTFYEERSDTTSIRWFVGKKMKGEGIFLTVDKHSMLDHAGKAKSEWLKINSNLKDDELNRHTHPIFVWWHSLAHKLVSDLSIDSGFQSASIAEKTYFHMDSQTPKAGILLYAVQEGGDGTLGGLTGLAPSFKMLVRRALKNLTHCSNDPLCIGRTFNPNRVNGSACHACMFVSETSCGLQNRFLDRNILLESLTQT